MTTHNENPDPRRYSVEMTFDTLVDFMADQVERKLAMKQPPAHIPVPPPAPTTAAVTPANRAKPQPLIKPASTAAPATPSTAALVAAIEATTTQVRRYLQDTTRK